jgi:hypothetical protein
LLAKLAPQMTELRTKLRELGAQELLGGEALQLRRKMSRVTMRSLRSTTSETANRLAMYSSRLF